MDIAQIGPSIRITGQVFADEPLTIAGRQRHHRRLGHPVIVTDSGMSRPTSSPTIVVSGTVTGNLLANARIVVNKTATIAGDLSAPAVGASTTARLQGRFESPAAARRVVFFPHRFTAGSRKRFGSFARTVVACRGGVPASGARRFAKAALPAHIARAKSALAIPRVPINSAKSSSEVLNEHWCGARC